MNKQAPLYTGSDMPPVSWQLHTIMNHLSYILQCDFNPDTVEDEMMEHLTIEFKHFASKDEKNTTQHQAFLAQIAKACGDFAENLHAIERTDGGERYICYNSRRYV